MKDIYGIDTNILIYYLTGKPEEKYNKCLKLIKKTENGIFKLKVVPAIFWEATWILEKFYKNSREKIAHILIMFLRLQGIECEEKELLIKSLNQWKNNDIDFADAYIINLYKSLNVGHIYSYDKHMDHQEIKCFKPGE
jgi:predicted nucleic-acid-binding protein